MTIERKHVGLMHMSLATMLREKFADDPSMAITMLVDVMGLEPVCVCGDFQKVIPHEELRVPVPQTSSVFYLRLIEGEIVEVYPKGRIMWRSK